MADDARLFIGLELSEEARSALAAYRRELAEVMTAGKLPDPKLYHLTLSFLGQVPRNRIPQLGALMDDICISPFSLTLDGVGTFKNGSILWIGVEQPCPELFSLQRALCAALTDAGFSVEQGSYSPHITLGRQVKLTAQWPQPPRAAFTVRTVTLFESTRADGRLTYLPLYTSNGK